jgi:hypothetical protein
MGKYLLPVVGVAVAIGIATFFVHPHVSGGDKYPDPLTAIQESQK